MYKTKATKNKTKMFTKSEDILREGSLQQVRQMYEEADKKGEIIYFEENRTALHYAALNSDSTVLLYLLKERRMNPNAVDDFQVVPLDYAIEKGSIANIQVLIQNGANFKHKDKSNLSIIDALEGYGHYKKVDTVKQIIAAAQAREQQPKVAQTAVAEPRILRQRDSHTALGSDRATEDEIISSTSFSSPSSSLVSTFFEKIGGWFSSSPVSSPEKETLLPSSGKKLKSN